MSPLKMKSINLHNIQFNIKAQNHRMNEPKKMN